MEQSCGFINVHATFVGVGYPYFLCCSYHIFDTYYIYAHYHKCFTLKIMMNIGKLYFSMMCVNIYL